MKPMLAFHYTERKAVFPCYGQPKLNGIRALWFKNQLISHNRDGEGILAWEPRTLPHIIDACRELSTQMPNLILDGELYCHGLSLQKINSRCSVVRVEAHPDCDTVKLHIFDIVSHKPFSQRAIWLENLAALVKDSPSLSQGLSVISSTYLNSPREAENFYILQKQEGFEGAMYRDPSVGYGFAAACTNKENRWNRLLKRKAELDVEGIIVGMEHGTEGKGYADMMGSIRVRLSNGIEFNTSSGVQIQHRKLIEQCIDQLVEQKTRVRVLFDEYSDAGIPLRGRIECIYDPRFA